MSKIDYDALYREASAAPAAEPAKEKVGFNYEAELTEVAGPPPAPEPPPAPGMLDRAVTAAKDAVTAPSPVQSREPGQQRGGKRNEAKPYVAGDKRVRAPEGVLDRPVEGSDGQSLIDKRGAPVNEETATAIKRSVGSMPNADAPAPFTPEALKSAKDALAGMAPEQRARQLARTDLPKWMRSAMAAAAKQIDNEDQAFSRTGVASPEASAGTRRQLLAKDGLNPDDAGRVAEYDAQRGGVPQPLAQATAGKDPGITIEEEAAAKAEGEAMQRSGIGARGYFQAGKGLTQAAHGAMAMALRAAGDEQGAKLYEAEGAKAKVASDAAAELMTMRSRASDAGIVNTGLADYFERQGTGASGSVVQNLPGMAAGALTTLATGNPVLGTRVALGLMSGQVFGQEYINGRTQGLAPAHAAGRGAAMAALEYIGERYGLLPQAMRALKGKAAAMPLEELPQWAERAVQALEKRKLFSAPVGTIVRGQAGEQIGEQITGAGQYLLDGTKLGLDQPISVSGFLENARDTAVQTFIATGAMQAAGAAGNVVLGGKKGDGYRQAAAAADAARESALKKWGFAFNGDPAKPPATPTTTPSSNPTATPASESTATPAATPLGSPAVRPAAPAPDKPDDNAPLNADDLLGTPVDDGAHIAATSPTNELPEPTDAQKKAGNYKVGRIKLGGLDISIENPQGSVRRGVDEDGKAWENTLQHHYGYIRGTEGNDGDHVDAFIKPGTPDDYAGAVWVVDQRNPKTGKFDEHKVLIGFDGPSDAEAAYRANYAPDWQGLGYLSGMNMPAFRRWIDSGNHKQPFSAGFKETKGVDQPDLLVPAPVVAPAPATGGAVPGGSGGNLGSVPAGNGGLGSPAPAPVPGSGTPGPVGDADGAGNALSDTPDFTTTWPRPVPNADGKGSMFEGLENDPAYLADAVKGVHQETGFAIQSNATTVRVLRDAMAKGVDPATGQPPTPERAKEMQGELDTALNGIDSLLDDYAGEFGDAHRQAFQSTLVPDLADLHQPVQTKAEKPTTKAPEPGSKGQQALDDLAALLGTKPANAGAPVTADSGSAAPAPAAPAPAQSGTYTLSDSISADGPTSETIKLVVRPDGSAAIQRDNGDVIDVTNMIRAGFSAERAIAQTLGHDTSGKNVSRPTVPAAPPPSATTVAQPAADSESPAKKAIKERVAKAPKSISLFPKTINGSKLLAGINRLGGLSPDLLHDLSFKREFGPKDKFGRKPTSWFNPPAGKGIRGGLFREGGMGDTNLIAEWLEQAGYIPPGTLENDYKAADEMARTMVSDALNQKEPQTLAEIEAEGEAARAADDAYYRGLAAEDAEKAEELRLFLMGEAAITSAEMEIPEDAWFAVDNEVWAGPATQEDLLQSFGWSDQEINDAIFQDQQVADANAAALEQEGVAGEPGQEARGDGPGEAGAAAAPGEAEARPADRQDQTQRVDAAVGRLTDAQVDAVAAEVGIRDGADAPMKRTLLLTRDAGQVLDAIKKTLSADEFSLVAPTREQLQAAADRAEQARQDALAEQRRLAGAEAARLRELEKKRALSEAAKIRKERADAAVDGFELGQEPPSEKVTTSDIVGQKDVFADAPAEPPAPPRPDPRFAPGTVLTTEPIAAPAPVSQPAPAPRTLTADPGDTPQTLQAKANALDALGDLAKLLGGGPGVQEPGATYKVGEQEPTYAMTPEQERALLPIMTRLFDAAFEQGITGFKDVARWSLQQIEAHPALGQKVAAMLTIDHLQGAYITMSSRYRNDPNYKGPQPDAKRDVVSVESKDEITQEINDAANPPGDVERDRPAGEEPGVAPPVLDGRGPDQADNGRAGRAPGGRGGRPGGTTRVPGAGTTAAGTRGDQGLLDDESDPLVGGPVDERSDPVGDPGSPPESLTDEGVEEAARRASADRLKRSQAQRDAEKLPVTTGDIDSVRETLPALLPKQQDDVLFAEQRFAKEDGYGVLFTNGTGTGKAQPLDAKLMTPTGWTTMGEIQVGDKVIAADGKPTRVLAVYPQGEKPIYRVTFSDGAATECCDEHLWETQTLYARRKASANPSWECAQPKVRPLSEIRATLDKQHFIPVAPPIELAPVDLAIPPYIMGAVLGDGCITQNAIKIASADPEIAERIQHDLPAGLELRLRADGKRCPEYTISQISAAPRRANGTWGEHPWLHALREMGLHGANSTTKFVPPAYLRGSIEQRTELLQGMLDTDGWVDSKAGSPYFTSVSRNLADSVAFLARSLGGTATINVKRPTYTHLGEKRDGQLAYSVCLNLPAGIEPFALPRKAALYRANTKYPPRRKIVGVERVGVKPAQCIAVEHPRHLYVTDDCILTHNTYTGLGIIKRYAKQGKKNILIVVPDDPIKQGWLRSAPALGLTVTELENTKDAGSGIVVTTYANLQDNNALARRKWDLVVADEAHKNGSAKDGSITDAGYAIRALTLHPEGLEKRTRMLHPELANEIDELNVQYAAAMKANNMVGARLFAARLVGPLREFAGYRQAVREEIDANQGHKRPRAVFLSATPFAWEKNLSWAQGYLFDWNKGHPADSKLSPYHAFMVSNFGWRIRHSKLTEPDERRVNRGVLQRAFNTRLKNEGVLSGRAMDSEFDYDRRFVSANSEIGRRIDVGMDWFWDTEPTSLQDLPVPEEQDYEQSVRAAMHKVQRAIRSNFSYLTRLRMLEAMKAEASIPYVRAHLEMGRKVVVFHDLIKGEHLDPFGIEFNEEDNPLEAAVLARWKAEFSDLVDYNWDGLKSPIEAYSEVFGPQLRLLNGQMKGGNKAKQASIDAFNDDEQGPMVLLVQSDKDQGWSGHDTTGKHQRVMMNLGLPLRPTRSIQQEGRIYRVGQMSNALFRYFNTQTNWEREAFARQMSRRASTTENLAMGEEARGLLEAYIAAFEDTGEWEPGHQGEGIGGKAGDRAMAAMLTEFDVAKTLYWSQLKKTAKTKAQEGSDYFATPEPLGLKMMQWTDLRFDESFIEPSGGHGAIARWMPEGVKGLAIEPSPRLAPRLELAFDGKVRNERFEDLNHVNKADGMAMNPPFGVGGKTAIEHLSKAYNDHLDVGGRIVALLPEGPAADARLEKFLTGSSERPTRVLGTVQLGTDQRDLRKGDLIITRLPWAKSGRLVRGNAEDGYAIKVPGQTGETRIQPDQIVDVMSDGATKETLPNAPGAHVVATIRLPADTFGRAGTNVRTRIVVIDKLDKDQAAPARVDYDFSQLDSVEALFDEIEGLDLPERTKPRPVEVDDDAPQPTEQDQLNDGLKANDERKAKADAKNQAAATGEQLAEQSGLEVIQHTANSGNVLRGVILRHVAADAVRAGPAPYAFKKDGGVFVNVKSLAAVLEKFPLPPVAQEERAVYAVREPDANYDLDLFGNQVPQPTVRAVPSGRRPAARRDVPAATALSVRADPAFPGVYRVSTQLVEVGRRELPVSRVRNWSDAAAALSSMHRYAVEHFDVLITDAAGKPLAVVGAFKGDYTQASVYPRSMLAEALRIEGASAAWGVHNHPSGESTLSSADYNLSAAIARVFDPSSVKWMGLAAVANDGVDQRYTATTGGYDTVTGMIIPGATKATVPVVERTLIVDDRSRKVLDSPSLAKNEIAQLLATDGRPGILFMDNRHAPQAWVPLDPADMGALRQAGRFDRLINSAAEGNATAAIIANQGSAFTSRTLDNMASALALADIRVLDVIDGKTGKSLAEAGALPSVSAPVLSQIGGEQSPGGVNLRDMRQAVLAATTLWSQAPGMPKVSVVATAADLPQDAQDDLTAMRALNTTRGLMLPDGRVFLVANRINNVAEGQAVLFHETYGHFGLRAYLGPISYESQMGLLRMANPKLAAEANAWYAAYGEAQVRARVNAGVTADEAGRAVRALAVEEALADRAGLVEPPKGWKLLMARLQKALRAIGWNGVADMLERMTEAETHALLINARRLLQGEVMHVNSLSPNLGGAMDRTGVNARTVGQGRIRRSMDELTEMAASQESWKDWYGHHQDTVRALFGDDAAMFQKILSATSQMQSVKGNVTMALRAYEKMITGEPFTGFLPAVARNLERIRADQALNGPKISEFERGNLGDVDAMAVDRHIAQLMFNTSTPNAKQIAAAKNRMRSIATRLGWTPKQAQAALWAANQVRKGTDPSKVVSYDRILEQRADVIEEIRARYGRGDGASTGSAAAAGADADAAGPGRAGRGTAPVLSQTPATPPAPAALKPSTGIVDTLVRLPVAPLARITSGTYTRAIEIADRSLSVFGDAYEYAKAGLVDQYGLTPEHTDRKIDMKTAIRVNARKTNEIIDKLRALDRAQSRVAYLWMTTNPDSLTAEQSMREASALFDQLPEEPRLVLESLKRDIEFLGDEAVELGLMSQDVRDRNRLAYLHRSYEKYEATDAGAKVARARAIKILGDQFKGRGMRHDAGMEQIAETDWWKRKTNGSAHDPSLKGQRFHRLELRATPDTATPQLFQDENGRPMGKLQKIVYWPEGEPIPRQYADWRNDGVWEARFFDKGGKVGMWRDFTLAERTKMGEIQEVKYATAVTMMQMVRDVETARFLDWVARNESVLDESVLPEGAKQAEASTWLTRSFLKNEWVQVPAGKIPGTQVKRYANLAGRWVPGPVWNDIRQIAELSDQNDLSQVFQKMLKAWKISKALALDTPIPTPTGWTTMGNLKPGDMVFDEHGKPCEVLQATETQLNHQCFEVEFSDGAKIVADAGHLWFTLYQGKPGVRETRDILATLKERTRGDNNHSIPVAGALELPDADLPVPPYVLGLWLGDGRSDNACMTVGDQDAAEIMANVTAAGVECGPTRADGRNQVTYFHLRTPGVDGRLDGRRKGEAVQAKLRALGVLGQKHIPTIYLRSSEAQRRELLQGLMDSDGHITDKGLCGFCTVDDALKDGVLELIRSLGYKPTAVQYETRCNGKAARPAWKLHFKAYADHPVFRLARKVARLCPPPETRQRSQTRQIVAVNEVPSVPVRCILVSSPSHLFLAGDAMVPTHNTALSPVTHMNNVMSNFMLADLHDIQARHLYTAMRTWAQHKTDETARKLLEDFQDNGGDAGMFNESEIREELFRPLLEELRKEVEAESGQSLITAAQVLDLLQHRQFRQAFAAIGQSKAAAAATWAPKKLMKLYGVEDEVFRLAAFIKARQDGLDDKMAGKFARDSFLNYEITAPWINAMRRSAFPFIAFTYRAAPMLARTMADKPHKLVKYMLVTAALNALAYAAIGGGDPDKEEKERALMVDEKAGKIWGFLGPKLMRMPWDDRNGNPVFLDIRRWIPAGDIVDTGQSQSIIPLPPPIIPGGPLALFAEFALNSSGFTGNDIVNQDVDSAAERAGKAADWLWKGVAPNFPGLPGTYATQGLVDAFNGRVNPGPFGQEKASPAQAAFSAVGIKVGSYPIETLDLMAKQKTAAIVSKIEGDLRKATLDIRRSGLGEAEQKERIAEKQAAAREKMTEAVGSLKAKRTEAGLQKP